MCTYHPIVFLVFAMFVVAGCNDEECNQNHPRSCSDYNHMLSVCNTDGWYNLPNCYVETLCTDYSDSDIDSDTLLTDTESDSVAFDDTETTSETESDTVPSGLVCEQVCSGSLVPCDSFKTEKTCSTARHCEWYSNSGL